MENPCNELDKRTKEYKDCIKSQEYKYFKDKFEQDKTIKAGEVIEKITKATGVKKLVEWVAGEDCGCDERKKKANKLRIKIANCPTQDQYESVKQLLDSNPKTLTQDQQKLIVETHNAIYNTNHKITKCGSCYKGMINRLGKMIELYK